MVASISLCIVTLMTLAGPGTREGLEYPISTSPAPKMIIEDSRYQLGLQFVNGSVTEDQFDKTSKLLVKAATGEADAQYSLGELYWLGQILKQDATMAAKWFRLSAEQGNSSAQYMLGWLYVDGNGVDRDVDKALGWYALAAEQGHVDAQLKLGMLLEGRNEEEALKWFTAAAESDCRAAQLKVGALLYHRAGSESITWFQRADEHGGKIDAQLQLGSLYAGYQGVDKNLRMALTYFQAAAVIGNSRGQYAMGFLYTHEEEIVDLVQAYMWFDIASKKLLHAQIARDEVGQRLSKEELTEANRRVVEYKSPANTNVR